MTKTPAPLRLRGGRRDGMRGERLVPGLELDRAVVAVLFVVGPGGEVENLGRSGEPVPRRHGLIVTIVAVVASGIRKNWN